MIRLILVSLLFASGAALAQPSFPQDVLSVHNVYRLRHHVSALVWDKGLQAFAQHYADRCLFQHSGSHYGENLAAGYATAAAAVQAWYAEEKDYSYWRPGFSHATGHFTQLVWKTTEKVGCGYSDCNGKNGTPGVYLVCEYSPAGNIINNGFFERNVLPE